MMRKALVVFLLAAAGVLGGSSPDASGVDDVSNSSDRGEHEDLGTQDFVLSLPRRKVLQSVVICKRLLREGSGNSTSLETSGNITKTELHELNMTEAEYRELVVGIDDCGYVFDDYVAPTPTPSSCFTATNAKCGTYSCGCGKGCTTTCSHSCTLCYCAAGQYASSGYQKSGTACTSCPGGWYQPSTGASSCPFACPAVRIMCLVMRVDGGWGLFGVSPTRGYHCVP